MNNILEFQTGFFGASGIGAGKHAPVPSDILGAEWANLVENATVGLFSVLQAAGIYGPFRLEVTGGVFTEYFNGNGVITGFTLNRSIHKFQVYQYDVNLDDPYSNSVQPQNYGGRLTSFDAATNLSNSFIFSSAPPSGVNNVRISYYIYDKYPSRLDGSCYLADFLGGTG